VTTAQGRSEWSASHLGRTLPPRKTLYPSYMRLGGPQGRSGQVRKISASRPGRTLPPGKTRYPLYRRLGGPQGRSGQVRKISASRPGHTLPPGKTRYPFYRRLGGAQDRSGQVRKISPPPGFDHRTVQPGSSVAIPTELPGPQRCL